MSVTVSPRFGFARQMKASVLKNTSFGAAHCLAPYASYTVTTAVNSTPSNLKYENLSLSASYVSLASACSPRPRVFSPGNLNQIRSSTRLQSSSPTSSTSSPALASPALSSSSSTCSTSSPSLIELRRRKTVHFPIDMKDRMRPLASNLRPFQRLSMKDANLIWNPQVCQTVTLLEEWDTKWRMYLQVFYDDQMNFIFPRSKTIVGDLIERQKDLEDLAIECGKAYEAVCARTRGSKPLSPARRQRFIASVALGMSDKLTGRQETNEAILARIVTFVTGWREAEKARWHNELSHADFCTVVELFESSQKKFKSASDGLKRLQKRIQREMDRAENARADSFPLRASTSST